MDPKSVSFITLLFLLDMILSSSSNTNEEHIDEAISYFISLMLFVGKKMNCNSIQQSIISLPIKFLRAHGLDHNRTTRSSDNDPTNSNIDS